MRRNRILCMLLLTAMFLSNTACGETASDGADTSNADSSEPKDYYETLGLPSFNGETFTILCQTGSESEIFADSENGEVVNDAVYASNRAVEEGLGINLEVINVDGGWTDKDIFINYVTSSVMSGSDEFQFLMGYMHYMPTLILDNLFLDINTLPNINLDNPWWADGFNNNATLNGRMYVAMGDVCTSALRVAVCIFANQDLMADYGYLIDDVYSAVRDGKWTYDMLTGMAKNASVDLNGDSIIDNSDQHGLGMSFMAIRAMTNAFAIDYTTRDSEGLPQIAISCERFINAYELMYNTIHTDWFYTAPNNYTVPPDMRTKFKEGRMMFLADYLGSTSQELRDMKQSYAVLPLPKYDEEQEFYRTEPSDAVSIMMVPITVQNTDLCGAVMECMNYEAYQRVTPAYFETTLQAKYARDEDSQEMMELVRDSLYFDFGYIFAGVIGNDINKLMDSSVNTSNITSILAAKVPLMEANLQDLLKYLR